MVLGLKAKNRKNSFQVDYLIHIQEIKPWPPSQSLRTLHAVLMQWERGDRRSGCTKQVFPSLGTGSGDGRIEFNESFRLPVTMLREFSARSGNVDVFQKNCIEFNLYESRRDKTVKGLLGTAAIDLADYAVVKEAIGISAPINCKRTYGNASQPILYLKIQSLEKSRMSSSSKDSLMGEASLDRNGVDSVSSLMSEEYTEKTETSSFTDDDVSSHSSLAVSSSAVESNGGSPLQNKESESEEMKTTAEQAEDSCAPALEQQLFKADDKQFTTSNSSSKGNSSHSSSSIHITSDLAWITNKIGVHGNKFSSSPVMHEATESENSYMRSSSSAAVVPFNSGENVSNDGRNDDTLYRKEESNEVIISCSDSHFKGDESLDSGMNGDDDDNATVPNNKGNYKSDFTKNGSAEVKKSKKSQENGKQKEVMDKSGQCTEDEPMDSSSGFDLRTQDSLESDSFSVGRDLSAIQSNTQNVDKHSNKHRKSVRSPIESHRSNALVRANPLTLGETQSCVEGFMSSERKDNKVHPKETKNIISDSKFKQLEQRIKRLETELREAAAIEVGLYAVVAEHGSSTNKVHAPARRLSRFYLHASNAKSPSRRGSAAKSAISGLVLVAKACGNDVPRLTFWLSNAIVLRANISESLGEHQLSLSGTVTRKNGMGNHSKISSPLKWHSLPCKGIKSNLQESSDDWDDPYYFENALEKVEVWIFSRIIESIWWQTLIPHMQFGAANAIHKGMIISSHKTCQRPTSSFEEEQGTFSLELWKEAFRDACKRICPVRAEGHECGCLPLLSRLIMEQCVARLDVAMFNAILRESVDDIPTDPVSDPISDVRVLPIPVGNASFSAGVQLKNAIGNWSRWLTDLFGIDDDDDTNEDVNRTCESSDDESHRKDASVKSFNLLSALSDLMMLPKDMLLSRTMRKEVCPTFGSSLIGRVMNAFVPDEFCPEPVPKGVLEALNAEDSFDGEDSLINFPCNAAPIDYLPPSAASVNGILGDAGSHYRLTRKGSMSLTKSYTSDDELDEMASPLSSICTDSIRGSPTTKTMWSSTEKVSQNATRYQLLREVWKNSDLL